QHHIHDADTLMIDGGYPLTPQIREVAFQYDPANDGHNGKDHSSRGAHDDRLVEWNGAPAQSSEEIHFSALCDVRHNRSPDCIALLKMPLNSSGVTAR